ncbi:SIS domain-containing protein [Lichenihabitans psoromatis]|uniref:SIS domain-containing protein n=1 Tax=Lichenihabitans psoromatis TaxID=2528642 RepID=UPI001035661C|nr:SIS domain-containing protein [Lichenihabitans psoromatis]
MTELSPVASHMAREVAEIPEALGRQVAETAAAQAALGRRLRDMDPTVVVTIARGSSDHAALYLKHLVETRLGLPCCSIGPSVASVYGTALRLKGGVAVTISQSGGSPDLLAMQRAAKAGGALTIAIVNDVASPIAREADVLLPLCSGREISVAATKTMVASLFASAALVGAWSEDAALNQAVAALPDRLSDTASIPDEIVSWVAAQRSLYTIGRGPTFAAAAEAALKLKETSAIHAEAFSSAEVLHGPTGLIVDDFPVLCFMAEDAARAGMDATRDKLAGMGARCASFDRRLGDRFGVSIADCGHPLLAPLAMLQSFYALAERVAQRRGRNPDVPPHLQKVTQTL